MNKVLKYIVIVFLLLFLTACKSKNNTTIITTNFSNYDFVRAIIKDSDINVSMLLKPGMEIHDYEPTPKDIISIKNSSLFIYTGGESDTWVNDMLDNIDMSNNKIVKTMDMVNLLYEDDSDEYDEHIWTSPVNAIKIVNGLKDKIIDIDPDNKLLYENNANEYIESLKEIDEEIRDIVKTSKRKELIFGDRFPLKYFTNEYGLEYYAAYSGCAEETEVSSKTIAFLIDKVNTDDIPVIFHIELSNSNIADTIAKETNKKVLEFNSIHNITSKDFDSGLTYIDIMNKNIEVLKEALN